MPVLQFYHNHLNLKGFDLFKWTNNKKMEDILHQVAEYYKRIVIYSAIELLPARF